MPARSGLVATRILMCVLAVPLMSPQRSVLNKQVAFGETKKIPEDQKNDGEKKKATEDTWAKNEDYGHTWALLNEREKYQEEYPHTLALLNANARGKMKQQAAGGNDKLRLERANQVSDDLVNERSTWKRLGRKTPEDYMEEHRACEAEKKVPTALQRTDPFHFSIHPSTYRNHPPSHSSCSCKLICWSKEGDWGHASDADWMNGDVRGTSAMFRCGIRLKKLQRNEKVQNPRGAARPNGKKM